MNLERELKQALRRQNPPAGFDERVLRRIARAPVEPPAPARPWWARMAMPVAASLVVTIGAAYYARRYDDRQQQVQAAQTAHDVVLALQIASEKVSAVQLKVQEIARHDRQTRY